jgi:hypothetical protein
MFRALLVVAALLFAQAMTGAPASAHGWGHSGPRHHHGWGRPGWRHNHWRGHHGWRHGRW